MKRRDFIRGAAGLFVPMAPAIIRPDSAWAQLAGGLMFPGPGTPHSAGGGGTVVFDAITHLNPPVSSIAGIVTFNHIPVGTPTAIAILWGGYQNGNPTSITYGGFSMSATGTVFGALTNPGVQILGLANPPSGTQAVSLTVNGYIAIACISVTGSDTTTCFRNAGSGGTGSGAASTATVSSASGDLVIDCVNGFSAGAAPSGPGGGQTSQYTDFWNGNISFGVSSAAGAGSVTDTWSTVNSGGANTWAAAIASFKHA